MKFRNRENQLMWERYVDPYTVNQTSEDQMGDPTVEDPMLSMGNEDSEMAVLEFEPEMGLETEEHEACNEVIYSDIKKLAEYSKRILALAKDKEFEPWMQAKLIKASDYVSDIWHRIDAEADFANTGFEQSDNIDL
jgi:hypothetical protein